jgi:molecular chaperone Hsp33
MPPLHPITSTLCHFATLNKEIMEDYLIRILAKETGVRGLACVTTGLANEAAERHGTTVTTTAVLERALTSGILLGALLKVGQRVAVRFEANGPVGKALVEADAYGRVSGYLVNPQVDLPLVAGRPNIVDALGEIGLLTVVKDLKLKEMAEGVVPLQTSTFDGDLTYYLNQSEQTPSLVVMGEVMGENGRLQFSGGVLIQAMPPNDIGIIRQFIERMQELPPLEALFVEGKTPEEILALLFAALSTRNWRNGRYASNARAAANVPKKPSSTWAAQTCKTCWKPKAKPS